MHGLFCIDSQRKQRFVVPCYLREPGRIGFLWRKGLEIQRATFIQVSPLENRLPNTEIKEQKYTVQKNMDLRSCKKIHVIFPFMLIFKRRSEKTIGTIVNIHTNIKYNLAKISSWTNVFL